MPEGPEIRIASMFINQVASTHTFGGKVLKGEKATKLADVPFEATEYTLHAESRGKELKVTYSTHSSKTLIFTILIPVLICPSSDSFLGTSRKSSFGGGRWWLSHQN